MPGADARDTLTGGSFPRRYRLALRVPAQPPDADLGIAHDRDHGEQAGEGDEPEAVEQGAASGHCCGQAESQRCDHRYRDGGGCHSPRIVGQGNDRARRIQGLYHDDEVTRDDVVVEGGSGDDPEGPQCNTDGDADRDGNTQAPYTDGAAGQIVGLDGDGDQCGFRYGCGETDGGGDVGRGLSPAGRQLLLDAIERAHARLLDPPNLLVGVRERVALYDSVAAARGKPIKLYINVGGGVASLGGAQNGRLIKAGLSRRLTTRNYPNRGVINVLGERRIPVIHLLQVEKLDREYDITDTGSSPKAPGHGLLFIKYRYNLWIVGTAALLVLLTNLFVLRLDLRQQVLGHSHPERMPPK